MKKLTWKPNVPFVVVISGATDENQRNENRFNKLETAITLQQNKSNKTCHLLVPIHLLSVVVNSGAENANEKASYIRSLSCLWGLNGEIKQ